MPRPIPRDPAYRANSSHRDILREATARDHSELDRRLSSLDLKDAGDYRLFLRAHGFWPSIETWLEDCGVETLLPDWAGWRRRGALEADLADLGVRSAPAPAWPPAEAPREGAERDAALFGAAYVLQGARLGSALLSRQLPADSGLPRRFLGEADTRPWGAFCRALEAAPQVAAHGDVAARWARAVFRNAAESAASLGIGRAQPA